VDYAYEAEFDKALNDLKDHHRRVKIAYQSFFHSILILCNARSCKKSGACLAIWT
jgi:hypothetical protein